MSINLNIICKGYGAPLVRSAQLSASLPSLQANDVRRNL